MSFKKIRLLHLIKSLDLGGIEKSTILYSNYLSKKLGFVGIYASKGFYDNTDLLSVNVKRFAPPYVIQKLLLFLPNLFNLLLVIKHNKISHIHYHHRIYIPFIFIIKLLYPQIVIVYTHHSMFNDLTNHFIIADRIIALNEVGKNDLSKKQRKKTRIIPHGVLLPQNRSNNSRSPINFAYVGRFVKSKGLLNLINTFREIAYKFSDIKLFLIGEGELEDKIKNRIKKLNLEDKIIIKKTMADEDKIYSNIHVLILPSTNLEGFGLTLIEAMSRKIMVIVSDIPIFREIIIHKHNGIIFNNNLDENLMNIFSSSELYNKLRLNGYKTVQKKYLLPTTIEKYLEVYSSFV